MTWMISRCRVLTGLDVLPDVVREYGFTAATVAYDAAIEGNAGLAAGCEALASRGVTVRLLAVDRTGSLADARDLAGRLGRGEPVVAMGGGSLLDCVKLALALHDPLAERVLSARQRSGWVIGPDRPRPAPLIAVPTTVGTAAEVSGIVSFVDGGSAKRVYTSLSVQPDVAVLDPRATAGMPGEVLVEGCLEILLRFVGPMVGARGPLTDTDRQVLRDAAEVTGLLCRIRRTGEATAPVRARLALLSAQTQRDENLCDRSAFTVKAWFLGNNLSQHLGVRKMAALANLIPAYWGRLAEGPALGSAQRAQQMWAVLREQIPVPVAPEPGTGFPEWLDWLGVPALSPLSDHDVETVALSCVRMWGGGLPMLGGVAADDVRAVLRGVRSAPATHGLPLSRG
ncbi:MULTISPECIES: daptide-type RiPP biosynthesis dehydogenase [unclassified Streptomyces]|uniref:daptide-type RiPP biosynthesis dehydogenase n=1 Tax=unclassified Streptomyces TaxID=2593676 RepID=UPI002E2AE99A|nr:daptide-type RiPP biosynthesis dehydogenase [Streptomyces sp. NBC_00223]